VLDAVHDVVGDGALVVEPDDGGLEQLANQRQIGQVNERSSNMFGRPEVIMPNVMQVN
jgi:hypothetical protein